MLQATFNRNLSRNSFFLCHIVLMNGSAPAVNCANDHATAILEAWYFGEEGGTAIAQTSGGENNPAGRLPVTFYSGIEQLPEFEDYSMDNRAHRYFKGELLYPFGYGLSYSIFEYSGLKLSSPILQVGSPVEVEVDVKNVGKRDGDEVVELYIQLLKNALSTAKGIAGIYARSSRSGRANACEADARAARSQLRQ